jgi:hypothetical protein
MGVDRNLNWDGLFNARDLGGLPTPAGETRWAAVVRSENPERLTEAGWAAAHLHGIRTVVDLRNADEYGPDTAPRPAEISTIRVPTEEYDADPDFWRHWRETSLWGTPLYYRTYLEAFPHKMAAVLTAIGRAEPGGVLVHCAAGWDRTGLATLMLLTLAGVAPEDIIADYALSEKRMRPLWQQRGLGDPAKKVTELVTREGTTVPESIMATLAWLDAEPYLLEAGMTSPDLAALRARLSSP